MHPTLDRHSLRTLRESRGFSRPEFLRTFAAVAGEDVKLRTYRAWERAENPVPSWVVSAAAAVLGLTAEEELGLSRWAGSSGGWTMPATMRFPTIKEVSDG